MNFKKLSLFILIVSIFAQLLTACNKPSPQVTSISALETHGLVRNDFAVLVDVRETTEAKDGIALAAKCLSLSQIKGNDTEWKKFLENTPKSKQVILYSTDGTASQEAAQILASLGYKVSNMGSYQDWLKAKLPTQKMTQN